MIVYKGFDPNLKCRGEQFEVGKKYKKPEKEQSSIRLCSSDGLNMQQKVVKSISRT